jgi:hypothetical protein
MAEWLTQRFIDYGGGCHAKMRRGVYAPQNRQAMCAKAEGDESSYLHESIVMDNPSPVRTNASGFWNLPVATIDDPQFRGSHSLSNPQVMVLAAF